VEKLVVSFSGGETSAYMCNWLLLNKSHEYDMKFIFANTGEEAEETLEFVDQCDKYFGLNVTWVEFDVVNEKPSFKQVNFQTAYRSDNPIEVANGWQNHPFRKMIERQGIPNMENMICTRELKEYPMNRYMSSIGWKPKDITYAIGIRADEIDRAGKHYYPLIHADISKPLINAFWSKMPFRLGIKTYEGNCKTCWKKSFRKLATISVETPDWFQVFKRMESEFSEFTPAGRKDHKTYKAPHHFFREHKTVNDVFDIGKEENFERAIDERHLTNYQVSILHDGTELDVTNGCEESCEVFS